MKSVFLVVFSAFSVLHVWPVKPASAVTFNFGTSTNAGNWQVSADGGQSYRPNEATNTDLVTPGILGTPGVWQAVYEFTLPEYATAAELIINRLGADDRIVLSLNGSIITEANDLIFDGSGSGIHDFGDGNGPVPFEFSGTDWTQPDSEIVLTSGFKFGEVNQLIAHVNNTGNGNPNALPTSDGLNTAFRVEGLVQVTDYFEPPDGSLVFVKGGEPFHVPLTGNLAAKMANWIDGRMDRGYADLSLTPDEQKGENGSHSQVGLIEAAAEAVLHQGGLGFITNVFEEISFDDGNDGETTSFLTPALLHALVTGQQVAPVNSPLSTIALFSATDFTLSRDESFLRFQGGEILENTFDDDAFIIPGGFVPPPPSDGTSTCKNTGPGLGPVDPIDPFPNPNFGGDAVSLAVGGGVYESHPGYKVGNYTDFYNPTVSVPIEWDEGVQYQHTPGSFITANLPSLILQETPEARASFFPYAHLFLRDALSEYTLEVTGQRTGATALFESDGQGFEVELDPCKNEVIDPGHPDLKRPAPEKVPEPSLGLGLLAIAGLGWRSRRSR